MENLEENERFIPSNGSSPIIAIEHWHRYIAIAPLLKDKIVLDLACGNGYGTHFIGKYSQKTIGIDIDFETVRQAKKTYPQQNITFIQSDGTKIPLKNHCLDTVVSFETLEHFDVEEQKKFLKEILRVLKTEGYLFLSTPNLDSPNYKNIDNQFHKKEFHFREFEYFLKNYFKNVQILGQDIRFCSEITNNNSNNDPKEFYSTAKINRFNYPNFNSLISSNSKITKFLIGICSNSEIFDFENSCLIDQENYLLKDISSHNQALTESLKHSQEYSRSLEQELKKVKENAVKEINARDKALKDAQIYNQSLLESIKNKDDHNFSLNKALEESNKALEESKGLKGKIKRIFKPLKKSNNC